MTINTDISNPNLTKLAKYMFFIESGLYHPIAVQGAIQKLEPTLNETFDHINVYIQDENNKDYSIQEQLTKEEPTFLYYITCNTLNPRFKAQLRILKNSDRFVDCYQYGDINSGMAVIRFKVFIKSRIVKLLESKYSEMYAVQEYQSIMHSMCIQRVFSKFDYTTNQLEFDRCMHVLLRTEDHFNKIVDELGLTDDLTIEALRTNEFDGKYSIEKETLTFDKINRLRCA